MYDALQSLRYTIRLLLKSPGFAVTAILIIGFGIGANTAIFSLINAVILSPLPFQKPDQLMEAFVQRPNSPYGRLSYPAFLDLCRYQRSFEQLALSIGDQFDLTGQGAPERFSVHYVSASIFKATNRPLVLGRPFTEGEDKPGGPLLILISERLWKSRFQADPNIIGKSLTLSEQSFQVIGVCPPQIDDLYRDPVDFYVPSHVATGFGYHLDKRDEMVWKIVGRLKEGVGIESAQADSNRIQSGLSLQYPDTDKGYNIRVQSLLELAVHNYSSTIWMLGAAAGCLLLISIANIANLLLARGLERRREMAVRAALGASGRQLVLQMISETAVLSTLGALLGVIVAIWSIALIKMLSPEDLYRVQATSLDGSALLIVCALTALVSLLSGCPLAWSVSNADPGSALKEDGGRAGTVGVKRQRTQSIIVTAQVALTFLLLVGTGLLARSFNAAQSVPLGFNPHHLLTARVYPTSAKYADIPLIHRFFDSVYQKIQQLPSVTDAAMNHELPFRWDWGYATMPFHIQGQPENEPGKEPTMVPQAVSPGYFKTVEIPLLHGRDFDDRDKEGHQNVVIVDNAFAQRFFPNESAIGKQIDDHPMFDVPRTWTIVGVVQTSLHNHPDNDRAAPFQFYFPYDQRAIGLEYLVLRTPGDPSALISEVRRAVASVDSDVVITEFETFDELVADKYMVRRLGTLVLSLFSCAALGLSAVGLYGLLAYSVSQRTRDIGIRIALGAQSLNILKLVIQQGVRLIFMGLLAGVAVALIGGRFIEGILYGVSAADPISLGTSLLVLGFAALLACLIPTLRATRINPIKALRE
jgi:putative ABC transport system permease protein